MNAEGLGQRRLIEDSAHPVWSPDGRSLAVVARREGNFDIYTVPLSGSGEIRLTTDPAGDTFPAWSPDGKRIAFSSERGKSTGTNIWVMNADGSEQRKLAESPTAGDEFASWSPDGVVNLRKGVH
jgi:Tol biopolymer transport system component